MTELALSPLKLATEDELIKELKDRNDACVVIRLKARPKSELFFVDYHSLTTCIGLAERAKHRMLAAADNPNPEPWDGMDEDFEQ